MFISMDLSELRESTAASGPPEDSKDILSGRHDPNALKVFQSSHPFFLTPFCFLFIAGPSFHVPKGVG